MQADVIRRRIEQLSHLTLCQPDRLAIQPHIHYAAVILSLVDHYLAHAMAS